jgi:hypothetical protein
LSLCCFSVRAYVANLYHVGYIVGVQHPVESNAEPPVGWLTLDWEERTYHLSPADNIGFIYGGPEYHIVVLNGVIVIARLSEQAREDGEHTDS